MPGRELQRPWKVKPKGAPEGGEVYINLIAIDADYVETLQLELMAGRDLTDDDDDFGAFLINETAAELFGADYPLGSTLADQLIQLAEEGHKPAKAFENPIVGVVSDFQYADMYTELQPVVFFLGQGAEPHILIRLHSGDLQATIQAIEHTWNDFVPDEPLSYSFFDDDFARLFEAEKRLGRAFGFFAMLAIIIACLGLFGLAAFMAEQRTKEIGVRKTLGASVWDIVSLMSRHFLWLLLIGNLVAWPIGYIAMNKWLEDFAFRIDIGVGIFVLTGAVALVLVVISVGGQALRASLANPVDSLRYD